MARGRAQDGQTLVELVALLPAIVLLGLVGWQLAVAAHAWTLAQGSARAAARAHAVGAPVERAARAALPSGYAARARVVTVAGARIRVRLAVPGVLPFAPAPGDVVAEAPLDGGAP